jgi:hypothetical protein
MEILFLRVTLTTSKQMFLRVEEIVYPTNNVYLAKILKLLFVKHIPNIIDIYYYVVKIVLLVGDNKTYGLS